MHRRGKGLIKRYIGKVTGLSRAQVTRLIGQYAESGMVRSRQGCGQRFTARYYAGDIALLAQVDEAHETLSGPATQKILYRQVFHDPDLQDALARWPFVPMWDNHEFSWQGF